MRQTKMITATQRLALGRLDALKTDSVVTRIGRVCRTEIRANEENARAVLRATWARGEEA